jgi:DNA-binding YbaB/EbfC family protein
MKDMMGMMKKVQEMQSKLGQVQAELEQTEVSGQSGGGLVRVTMTVKGNAKSLSIDPSLLKSEDKDILEDLLIAALNDARAKGDALMAEKMGSLTAGLPIPPGLKLF